MDFKEVQDEYTKLRQDEESSTINRIKLLTSRRSAVFDLSNYFFFGKSSKFFLKSFRDYLNSKKPVESLVLQNCCITSKTLVEILKLLKKHQNPINFLDISNNRLKIEPIHSEVISQFFAVTPKPKSLILKGNNCANPTTFKELYSKEIILKELNLYDSGLSADALLVISRILSVNRSIRKLNLGYNSEAFENYVNVHTFGQSVGANSNIMVLNLSDNASLGRPEHLRQLCEGIKQNRSLNILHLGGLDFEDEGAKILVCSLLQEMPIPGLDIQNNNIGDIGLTYILTNFPCTLTFLDVSYNTFTDNSSILTLAQLLKQTKSLRKLSISHCFELESFNSNCASIFCESITKNDSLAELLCEGIKIPGNPDDFCARLGEAIEIRKLSLTYKISAINGREKKACEESESLLAQSSIKVVSKMPSDVWDFKETESGSLTEKKYYIDSPNQEPIKVVFFS